MSNQIFENNGVNGTATSCKGPSPGRCSLAQQRGPGRNPATAKMKWNKEVNKVVMECFYRSRPFDEDGKPIRGYRQRMFREWRDRGMFESTEQRVCDQAMAIRKNGWLSELELEMIRRKIENESQVVINVMDGVNVDQRSSNKMRGEKSEQENVAVDVIDADDVDESEGEIGQEQSTL